MRTMNLSDDLIFKEDEPFAEPLWVDKAGRILRFCLKPHQHIIKHAVPNSPFYVVILSGQGVFTDGAGGQTDVAPGMLLVFDPGEQHSVKAGSEELVFVGFLHGAPGTREEHLGGTLGESS